MTVGTDKWDQGPFPGSLCISGAIGRFLRGSAEFTDSCVVLAVTHPRGPDSDTNFMSAVSGNPHAAESLSDLWLQGLVPDGSWFATPSGVLPADCLEEGEPGMDLPWLDSIQENLETLADGLALSLDGATSGLLVLATAGDGPFGSTKAFAKCYGNSLACHGALANWRKNTERGSDG